MMSDVAMRSLMKKGDYGEDVGVLRRQQQEANYGEDVGVLRRRQQEENDRENEVLRLRSGSAPPTVDGSSTAFKGLYGGSPVSYRGGRGFGSEEELRADPAYANYYYMNANLNPRFPPPLVSKEDWRFSQRRMNGEGRRLNGEGGENVNGERSVFSMQAGGVNGKVDGAEWGGDDGLIGLPALGLGSRQRSIADIFPDEKNGASSASKHAHHLPGRNVFDDIAELTEAHFAQRHQSSDDLQSGGNHVGSASHSYASALGSSLSRSSTPDAQFIPRVSSPSIPPIGEGRSNAAEKRSFNRQNSYNAASSNLNESVDLASALAGMNLSQNDVIGDEKRSPSSRLSESDYTRNNANQYQYLNKSDSLPYLRHSPNNPYLKVSKSSVGFGLDVNDSTYNARGPSTPTVTGRGSSLPAHYQHVDDTHFSHANYNMGGFAVNPSSSPMMASQLGNGNLPHFFEHAAPPSALGMNAMDSRGLGRGANLGPLLAASELQNASRLGNLTAASPHQLPMFDPLYLQYLRSSEVTAAQIGALNESARNNNAIEVVHLDQQTKMVTELDGQIMRCVRDQNGNHVIQKCIECVPEGEIRFIVSTFYDQVVTLSTHPYGCRVNQVEHMLNDRLLNILNVEIIDVKEARRRFDKASLVYDQAREKFMSLRKSTKFDVAAVIEEELHNARTIFEEARFNLVGALHNIEAKKRFEFLEAVTGVMDAHLRYFQQGYRQLQELEPFIIEVLAYAQKARESYNEEQISLCERMVEYKKLNRL